MKRMKLAIVGSILSLFLTARAFAQATTQVPPVDAEPQTLSSTSTGTTQITGWFLAPTFGTTGFGGRLSYSPGLRGGIYLNRSLAIGFAAQGLASDDSDAGDFGVRNVGGYGGLLLQYVIQSNRLVHASVESTVGTGRWCSIINDDHDGCVGRKFLAFEPMANLEINLTKHMRIATGVGYRLAVAGRGEGPSSRDMSSLVARTSLVFGSF